MTMPGFTAEMSLSPAVSRYRASSLFDAGPSQTVVPQLDSVILQVPGGLAFFWSGTASYGWTASGGGSGGGAYSGTPGRAKCLSDCDDDYQTRRVFEIDDQGSSAASRPQQA
jgi:hypothetical protein